MALKDAMKFQLIEPLKIFYYIRSPVTDCQFMIGVQRYEN
jgi:hypothetical protein